VDENCLTLIRDTHSATQSASGVVLMDIEASPYPSTEDTGPENIMDVGSFLIPPDHRAVFSPCVYLAECLLCFLILYDSPIELAVESNQSESLWSLYVCFSGSLSHAHASHRLDHSKLCDHIPSLFIPTVDEDASVVEACIIYLDPISPSEVLSAQLNHRNVVKQHGLTCLRPRMPFDRSSVPVNLTPEQLKIPEGLLNQEGRLFDSGVDIPPFTFTQSISRSADSVYSIENHAVASDHGGMRLSGFWQSQVPPPPLPSGEPTVEWPVTLKQGTLQALSKISYLPFPQSPTAIHDMNIAGGYSRTTSWRENNNASVGDQHHQSIYELLVPSSVAWHTLPRQLSGGLDVLANAANFDMYGDPDCSLVPLAQVGRGRATYGMTQSPAGIPLAQYHLSGGRRTWIAVANHHRHALFLALPSERSDSCQKSH
jgi:hypothetical protein